MILTMISMTNLLMMILFDDDEIFPEPSKDDRDYVSINITDTDDDDPSVAEEESQETETPSEESDEKE